MARHPGTIPRGAANRLQKDHYRVQPTFHPALTGFPERGWGKRQRREVSFAYLSI